MQTPYRILLHIVAMPGCGFRESWEEICHKPDPLLSMYNSISSCKMNPLALHLSANTRLEENRGRLSQRQGLTATQKQVKALNAQIEMMGRDRILTADLKREKIDRMMATRNKRVQQAVERVYPYSNH